MNAKYTFFCKGDDVGNGGGIEVAWETEKQVAGRTEDGRGHDTGRTTECSSKPESLAHNFSHDRQESASTRRHKVTR